MSLRGKIVLLFLGMAVVPMLVVAAFGYQHATQFARWIVLGNLDEDATVISEVAARRAGEIEAELERLAASPETRALGAGAIDAATWTGAIRARLGSAGYVEAWGPGNVMLAASASAPPAAIRCHERGGSRSLTLSAPAPALGSGGYLLARVPASDLLPSTPLGSRSLLLLSMEDGEALYASSCALLDAGPIALPSVADGEGAPTSGTSTGVPAGEAHFDYSAQGKEYIASLRPVAGSSWAVVAASEGEELISLINRVRRSYGLLVVFIALSTVLGFSLLIGRVTLSLEELTEAAERIGEGDLNPWLPPPGQDEVGQVARAFGEMLARIRQMVFWVDQSGRLAVVGQVSSYLAHEIRNPLSSIKMNLQSLRREAANGTLPPDCEEAVEISLREVERLASSVNSVLQLGRPASESMEILALHEVVTEAAELLAREVEQAGIKLVLELDAAADRVRAAPGQLKGVFLNLMLNAIEAQPRGGRITIRSRLGHDRERGPMIDVHLLDEGPGVAPEIRDRIFEPFFSTKPNGSGIGLALALRTIHEFGGDLRLVDLPGARPGTEFVVALPLAPVVEEPMEAEDSERTTGRGVARRFVSARRESISRYPVSDRDTTAPRSEAAVSTAGLGPVVYPTHRSDGGEG